MIGDGKCGVMIGDVGLFCIEQNVYKIMRMMMHPNKIQPSAREPISLS
jgi:hypothetical protein